MILKSNDENLKHKVSLYLKSIEIQATFQIISLLVLSHNQISRPRCQTPISIYQDLIAFSWASISFKNKK